MTTATAVQAQVEPEAEQVVDPYTLALDVFRLVKAHATPPFPNTYALWYAYVSGSNPEIITEIDEKAKRGDIISPYDINQLCETYLTAEDREAKQAEISQELERGMVKALKFFDQGVKQGSVFADRVGSISSALKEPGSDHNELLDRLMDENKKMLGSSQALKDCMLAARDHIQELTKRLTEISDESLRDGLTGVANRRAFNRKLAEAFERAMNERHNLCLVLADLDHFKSVNDTYGHQAGDSILQAFAKLLVENVKGGDTVARYGGEEFAIILPEISTFDAHNLMTQIRHKYSKLRMRERKSKAEITRLTASFGISCMHDVDSPEDMISRADELLYQAKDAGRNTVKTEFSS